MGFKQTLLAPIILIVYLFVAIFDILKNLFESIGEQLVKTTFKIK